MANLPFPYRKRRAEDDPPPIDPNVPVDPVTDEALRRGAGTTDQYPDPNLPVEPLPVESAPAVVQPAVDPALLQAVRPRRIVDAAAPAVAPFDPTTQNVGTDYGGTGDLRSRRIETDPGGRPIPNPTIKDSAARNRDFSERVDAYVPRAEPKWKRFSRLGAGVASMVAASVARDPETASRAANAVSLNASNPKFIDENWRRQKQAEVGRQVAEDLAQKKTEAQIGDMGMVPMIIDGQTVMVPRKQAGALAIRQKGVDARGQRVSDQKMSEGLSRYNQLKNYDPSLSRDAGLKKIFEENYGLHDLPAKNDDKYEIKMVNGEYEWIPKKPGEVSTVKKDGEALVDPSHVADQSVKLPNGTVLDHLTPREAALMEGKVYESEQDRKSRERIAAGAQAGANSRAASRGGNGSAINSSVKGAVAGLSKFRQMSANIEKQKLYYGTADGPAPDDHPAIKALYDQRDAYEADLKKMYGQYIELDDKGKPKGLRDDAITPPNTSPVDLTGQQRSLSGWRKQYPRVTAQQEAAWKAKVEAAGGTVIK